MQTGAEKNDPHSLISFGAHVQSPAVAYRLLSCIHITQSMLVNSMPSKFFFILVEHDSVYASLEGGLRDAP